MDFFAMGVFAVTATALLGSPGPGIAALVAVGRTHGLTAGMRYYTGLQVGLALAAGISAAGLFSLLAAFPHALRVMTWLATGYLLYLAYRIATSPVGGASGALPNRASASAGLLLGLTNPKSYVAFASLVAFRPLYAPHPGWDAFAKWTLMVLIMVVVDFAWLAAGVALRRARLSPPGERALNLLLAATIVAAALLSLL